MLNNIIFQCGDFYNQENSFLADLTVNMFGALIGTGTALLIFTKTVNNDKLKDEEKERRIVKQRLHYFSSMTNSIINITESQKEHIKEFYEKVEQNPLDIPLMKFSAGNDIKRFSEIQNHEDYYHAYLTFFGYSIKSVGEYRDFFRIIDYFHHENKQMVETLKNVMQFDYERKIKYKAIVEGAMDETATIFNQAKQANMIDEFADFLNNLLLQFYDKERDFSDLNGFQSEFVGPLKTEIIMKYRHLEIAMQLAARLKEATYIFSEIQISNKNVASNFASIYGEYSSSIEKLKALTERLDTKF